MKTTYNKQTIVSIQLITEDTVPFIRIDYNHKEGWPWNRKIVPSIIDYNEYIELHKYFANTKHTDQYCKSNDIHVYYKPYVRITFNNGESTVKFFEDIAGANVFYNELREYLKNNEFEIID